MGKQQRSRSRRSRRRSNQHGGFIRGGTPQFAELCGPNPLNQYAPFDSLNTAQCVNCPQSGGYQSKRSRKNSRKQRNN